MQHQGGMMGGTPGGGPNTLANGNLYTPQAAGQGMRPPFSGPPGTPLNLQQQQQLAFARQQQLAAMQAANVGGAAAMGQPQSSAGAGGMGASGMDPRMQMYQQQMLAQAQLAAAQQQQAGGAGVMQGRMGQGGMMGAAAGGNTGAMGPPGGFNPQMAQYQAMQQQQQAQLQQQQLATAQAVAAQKARLPPAPSPVSVAAGGTPRAKSASVPPQPAAPHHVVGGVGLNPAPITAEEDPTSHSDIFDVVTARQLAANRFARQHDLLAGVFEPWHVDAIVDGKKRKRELDDAVKLGRNPLQGGFAGVAQRDGELSSLACTAVEAQVASMDKGPIATVLSQAQAQNQADKKEQFPMLSVEERRAKLLKMKEAAERDIDEMKKRFEAKLERIRTTASARSSPVPA